MSHNGAPTLDDLRSLLERDGKHPVLLPIRSGSKACTLEGWSKITYAATREKKYQDDLRRYRNTGVLLGAPGDGLCSLDLDIDELVDPYLDLHPAFRQTWCTRGHRGAQLWFYPTDFYPHQCITLKLAPESPLAAYA